MNWGKKGALKLNLSLPPSNHVLGDRIHGYSPISPFPKSARNGEVQQES